MKAQVEETLAALSDATRRRTVDHLRRGPVRAGELARVLGLSPPAMSRHLRTLREYGLIEEVRDPDNARVRLYRLRRRPFAALRAWLDQVEAFWSDQLGSFKDHVERRR